MCVEACPTEAITESKLFEFSFTNRSDAIYTKDELLVDDDGTPKKLPWEDWREGDDLHDLGLDAGHLARRATPPTRARCSGRASSATACARPRAASRAGATTRPPGTKPLREVLEAHLLDEDIPLAHRGMQGRVWRAKKGAERNTQEDGRHAGAHEGAARRPQGGQGRGARPGRRRGRLTHARTPSCSLASTRATWPDVLVFAAAAAGDPGRRGRRRHLAQPGARRPQSSS